MRIVVTITAACFGVLVAVCAAVVWTATAHAEGSVLSCQRVKFKAQGRFQSCMKKNRIRIFRGESDVSRECLTTFQRRVSGAGPACRFIDNGDGTIDDLDTGLTWEKKDTVCPGLHCVSDTYSSLDWQTDYLHGYDSAGAFYDGLNTGASSDGSVGSGCFAGHCDWRVPTIEELRGILDTTQGACAGGSGPCIDPIFAPTSPDCHQSTTLVGGSPEDAWKVNFGDGTIMPDNKYSSCAVRVVRGGL